MRKQDRERIKMNEQRRETIRMRVRISHSSLHKGGDEMVALWGKKVTSLAFGGDKMRNFNTGEGAYI